MTLITEKINALTASTSQNKAIRIPVAVPSGASFVTRHITKETLFKLNDVAVEFATLGGDQILLTMAGGPQMIFAETPNALLVQGGSLGTGAAGVPAVVLTTNARVRFHSGTDTLEVECETLTDDRNVSFRDFDGYIDMQPQATISSPTTGSTITLDLATHRLLFLELVATIAALTVNFPVDPVPGDRVSICSLQEVTALTLAHADTIYGTLTTINPNQARTWMYVSGTVDGWVPIS